MKSSILLTVEGRGDWRTGLGGAYDVKVYTAFGWTLAGVIVGGKGLLSLPIH